MFNFIVLGKTKLLRFTFWKQKILRVDQFHWLLWFASPSIRLVKSMYVYNQSATSLISNNNIHVSKCFIKTKTKFLDQMFSVTKSLCQGLVLVCCCWILNFSWINTVTNHTISGSVVRQSLVNSSHLESTITPYTDCTKYTKYYHWALWPPV